MDVLKLFQVIENERIRQKIPIKDLCFQADISLPTYYHWLEGRCEPRFYTLSRIMDVLNLKIKVIRTGGKE